MKDIFIIDNVTKKCLDTENRLDEIRNFNIPYSIDKLKDDQVLKVLLKSIFLESEDEIDLFIQLINYSYQTSIFLGTSIRMEKLQKVFDVINKRLENSKKLKITIETEDVTYILNHDKYLKNDLSDDMLQIINTPISLKTPFDSLQYLYLQNKKKTDYRCAAFAYHIIEFLDRQNMIHLYRRKGVKRIDNTEKHIISRLLVLTGLNKNAENSGCKYLESVLKTYPDKSLNFFNWDSINLF